MITTFKGEQITFWTRIVKKIAPIVLVLAILFLKVKFGKTFSEEYKIYFYIFGIVCFLLGLYYHIRDIRTVVTEVRFFDNKFQVLGLDFNSKFEDILDIDKTSLEIKQQEKTNKIYIEIYSDDKYYYINNYSDWKRKDLVELINEYRKRNNGIIYGSDLLPEIIKT